MRTKTYNEWMQSLEGRIGTHYDGCFMNHPECAALMGGRAATQQIVSMLRSSAQQIVICHNHDLLGLDVGEAEIAADYIEAMAIERGEHKGQA